MKSLLRVTVNRELQLLAAFLLQLGKMEKTVSLAQTALWLEGNYMAKCKSLGTFPQKPCIPKAEV